MSEAGPPEPTGHAPAQPAGDPTMDPPRTGVRITAALVDDVIDVAAAHDDVVDPEAGAVGLFTGVVRNHHDGHAVSELTYEAWPERAPRALREVAESVAADHPGVRAVHVVHRVGRLEVGDVSIVCAASAPHRAEALAAAGDLIDRVKADVPVWKREVHADGAVSWPNAARPDGGPDPS